MSASGKTPNFDFPLYEVQDNFAPLTSFNLLSNKADQQLALVKSSADTAEALSSANEQDIQALETWKAGLMSQLSNIFAPRNYNINSNIQGANGPIQAKLVLTGDLLYIYSNNLYTTANMIHIPIEAKNDAYPIFSTPEIPIPDMKENLAYELGSCLNILITPEPNANYNVNDRSIVLIRQNSITYACIRLNEYDVSNFDRIITSVNVCVPLSSVNTFPL